MASTIGLLVVAIFVFLLAGHDQSFGPLDVRTAQLFALGIWIAAPVVGGLMLRYSSIGPVTRAAAIIGVVIALAVAWFPVSGFGEDTCSISLPPGRLSYDIGRLAVGGLVGAGMGFATFATGVAARQWISLLPGIALAAIVNNYASAAAYRLFYDGVVCLLD